MEPCIEQSSRMNSGYGFHCQRGMRLQDWAKAKKEKEKEKEKKGGEKKARQLDPVLRFAFRCVCAVGAAVRPVLSARHGYRGQTCVWLSALLHDSHSH